MDNIEKTLLELQDAVASFDKKAVASISAQLLQLMESSLPEYPESYCRSLQQSLDDFDFERATELCKRLTIHLQGLDQPYPTADAEYILGMLQRKQLFNEMVSVADQLIQSGSVNPSIKRRYAQALIDTRQYSAAISILTQLTQECEDESHTVEIAQAKGLLGRAYKQLYVNAVATSIVPGKIAQQALARSFAFYHDEYLKDRKERIWHGINAVAIYDRAHRDGINLPSIDAHQIASDILASVEADIESRSDPLSIDIKQQVHYLYATAAEACVALGDFQSALHWLDKYLDDQATNGNSSDAFEVGSTLRQFEEVWQLNDTVAEQSHILQVLRAALLKRKGGSVSLKNPQSDLESIDEILDNKSYEAILGAERFKNLRWLKRGFERAECVCKFTDQFGDVFGTGFLMRSEDLHLTVPSQWVILTNAHVISNDAQEQRGKPKARGSDVVRVQFEAGAKPEREYLIDRILAWSPRDELDFSVLALTEQGDFTHPYNVASALPLLEDDQRIYLIGHPRGGQLSFSLYDNKLIDHEVPKLHYRSPSQGGSSGSPVFNQDWDLIGLHHAGGKGVNKLNGKPGTYAANEGLWIKSIVAAIDAQKDDKSSSRD